MLLAQNVTLSALQNLLDFFQVSFGCPHVQPVSCLSLVQRLSVLVTLISVDTAEGKETGKCEREMTGNRPKVKSFLHTSLEKECKSACKTISEYKLVCVWLLTDFQWEIFGWSYCHPQPSALPCTFNRYGSLQGRGIWSAPKSACGSPLCSARCIREAFFCPGDVCQGRGRWFQLVETSGGVSLTDLIHSLFQGQKVIKLQLLQSDIKGNTCFIQCVFNGWKCSQ